VGAVVRECEELEEKLDAETPDEVEEGVEIVEGLAAKGVEW